MQDKDLYIKARVKFDATNSHNFSFFFRRVMATVSPETIYQHNWHVAAIAEYLRAVEKGQMRRLIINMPPRMLKSTLVSVAWPAWLLGHKPHARIMVASYAQSLAIKHSTDCRLVMRAPWYHKLFPGTQLTDDQNEKDKFTTTARGYRLAVAVGGAATGEGGDILIADDPINALQASQAVPREAVNRWFEHTFASRLDDKQHGGMVLVMQRLHADDLSGYLLQKGGWAHLCLPAIAPEKTIIALGGFKYTRQAGRALHAAREPLALLEEVKREIGSANFNAQYQQAPLALAGSMVKPHWFARFDLGEVI